MSAARVAIVQESVRQYRERFYQLLRQRLAQQGVALTLIHSNPTRDQDIWSDAVDLPWAVRVPPRRVRVGGTRLVWQPCHQLLRGSDLVIVEQASKHLLNYVLAAEQRLGRRRLALWGHGRNFYSAGTSRAAEWVKARLSRTAHWWFAYTELSADVVAATGFPRERITVVQNAFDTHELTHAVSAIGDDSLCRIRSELGLNASHVGLFMGALSREKHLEFVCEAADAVRAATGDFALLVVGGGPGEAVVEEFARSRPWVRWIGPRFGGEKAQLLRLADVLLVPAWAGLVVLDAFASDVPLVVSASHAHPPEVSYIRSGVNGLIVDDGGSAERFGHAVAALLQDEQARRVLVQGCRAARERYTVDEMVCRFACGIERALAA